jgi:hypothetical protein
MIDITVGEAMYIVTSYHEDTHSTVLTLGFKSKVDAMEIIDYARKAAVPGMQWDYEYVAHPSVEYAKYMIDMVKKDWGDLVEDDPDDYIAMGWVDSRGRP